MQLAPNVIIAGRFKLNRQLGRGGMGSVWHATHLGLDIPCAVKFIEGEYAKNAEAQVRFEREAKSAAQLRSPNVVQILDHGISDGTPYIAMELLDGEDLGKRIQKTGRIAPQDVMRIVNEVCRALAKAHAANIVHRDLKPDNIYLVKDDDREIAKVLDFGIAKSQTALEGGNTRTGAMLGTPYYMSPEQAQGTRSVDWRADLWSLGVIVYQCVTGQLPFQSEALGDLLVKIIVNPIPVPSHIAPDVPALFDHWWARAAARDPAQRYQSAKDFAEALSLAFGLGQMAQAAAAQGAGRAPRGGSGTLEMPMVAPPGFGMTPTPGAGGGHPSAAVVAAGPGGAQMAAEPAAATTGAPTAQTYDAPSKSRAPLIATIATLVVIAGGIGVYVAVKPKGSDLAAEGEGRAPATATTTSRSAAPASAASSPPATGASPASPTSSPAPPEEVAHPAESAPPASASAAPDGGRHAPGPTHAVPVPTKKWNPGF